MFPMHWKPLEHEVEDEWWYFDIVVFSRVFPGLQIYLAPPTMQLTACRCRKDHLRFWSDHGWEQSSVIHRTNLTLLLKAYGIIPSGLSFMIRLQCGTDVEWSVRLRSTFNLHLLQWRVVDETRVAGRPLTYLHLNLHRCSSAQCIKLCQYILTVHG